MNESHALDLIHDVIERQGKILWLENSSLHSLPPLPNQITELYLCKSKNITEIPELPQHLLAFSCTGTPIRTLPSIPNKLQRLIVSDSEIEYLPGLPQSLYLLNAHNSNLKELPALPEFLCDLWCGRTNITEFPPLPSVLQNLDCSETRITKLPPLPPNLCRLEVQGTSLRELPERFPETLDVLYAFGTLLPDKFNEETPNDYLARVKKFQQFVSELKPALEEHERRKRIIQRCKAIKEELMAVTWHTDRVLAWCDPNAFSWED